MAWFVPAMMAISTGLTVMGHKQNIKSIKANLAWKNYDRKLQYLHDRTKLAKKQTKKHGNVDLLAAQNNIMYIYIFLN